MSTPEKSKEKPGQKRLHKPVSAEAARVGMEIEKARGTRTLKSVAAEVPMSHQNLSKIEAGRSSLNDQRTRRTVMRLGEIFDNDFGLDWVRKHLNVSAKEDSSSTANQQKEKLPRFVPLTLLGRVTAGDPCEPIENKEEVYVLASDIASVRNARALKVVGDSMRDAGVLDGDIIIVGDVSNPQGRIVVAVITIKGSVEVTLKRWRQTGNKVTLEPANPDYQPITLPVKKKSGGHFVHAWGALVKVMRTVEPPPAAESVVDERWRKAG